MAVASMAFNVVGAFRGLSLRPTSTSTSSSSSSSFLRGDLGSLQVGPKLSLVSSGPQRLPLTIQNAHKKGAGSTKNGRDSKGQRLGVKIYGDQVAKAGSIIVRQRGTKFHAEKNVGLGKDHTIFSLIDGMVKFEKFGPDKKKISVYPREVQPENPNSYRVKKRENFGLQRERKKARKEGYIRQNKPELTLASADAADADPVLLILAHLLVKELRSVSASYKHFQKKHVSKKRFDNFSTKCSDFSVLQIKSTYEHKCFNVT
ncbi:hypothetical protein C1H46_035960 [Malus baccata]|uniref:Large ribosomal subunit protein bL27c n=1 Tax=Malus baccata TaxID=106549 RepID=A0A540KWC9_MALBA|nr:hypothetical protein C1H46_035960 [Malus baccata]